MKRIICMLLVLSSVSVFSQKEFKVISLKQISSDISARTNQREDPKGEACALVKVQIPMRDVLFDGDIIGEIAYKTNEYWVYMPEKSSHLLINKAGYSPLNIDFKNYDIPVLESKGTYELCLLEKLVGAPQLYNEGMIALAQNDMITAFDKLQSAADAGYGMAYYQLGNMQIQPYEDPTKNIEDPNTTETYQAAFEYYKKAVDAGVPEAMLALGDFIKKYNEIKEEVSENPERAKWRPNIYKVNIPKELCEPNKAIEMIREAANKGIVEAQYMMLGDDQWCEENADKGIAVAQFGMGLRNDSELSSEEYCMLENTIDEISSSENFEKAAEWYQKAAENGLDAAQWRLAELYARGLGVEENINKAIELRSKAAEQGNIIFQVMMGMMYAWGGYSDYETYAYSDVFYYKIDIPKDIDEADKWLRKVNHQQLYGIEKRKFEEINIFPRAMDKTAEDFINESRYERAIYWYQRLADMGYTDALCNLGKLYFEGKGFNKDYQKAKELFEKAISDDEHSGDEYSERAKAYLGVIYRDGLGVESNQMKAKTFLADSADKNDAKGMYELAILFEKEGNLETATKLFNELKNGWGLNDDNDYYKNKAKNRQSQEISQNPIPKDEGKYTEVVEQYQKVKTFDNVDTATKAQSQQSFSLQDAVASQYADQLADEKTSAADKKEAYEKADKIYAELAEKYPDNAAYVANKRATLPFSLPIDQKEQIKLAAPHYATFAEIMSTKANRSADENKMLTAAYSTLLYYYVNCIKDINKGKEVAAKLLELDPENQGAKAVMGL